MIGMKYFTIYSRLLPLGKQMRAMAMWPFVIVKRSRRAEFTDNVRQHEEIHLKQQLELWLVGFWMLYAWYYVRGLLRYHRHMDAYALNPFEREAYANSGKPGYLEHRHRFAWLEYK